MTESRAVPQQAQEFLSALGAGPLIALDRDGWWFHWADSYGVAFPSGESTSYELVLTEEEEPGELRAWLEAQPPAVRESLDIELADAGTQLTFKGVVDPDMSTAQVRRIGEVLERIVEARATRARLIEARRTEHVHRPAQDPMILPVANAWLVYGSEASMPSTEGLAEQQADAGRGDYRWTWTVNKATRAGDLLLFYFTSPRKSLQFVARAASDAYFDRGSHEADDQPFSPSQWWAHITPLIPIPHIGTTDVQDLLEQPVLRGASGKYCKPAAIERLHRWVGARHPDIDLGALLPVPVANPDLPHPATMTLAEWRSMAAGALYPEKVVETHVVDPLVRFVLEGLGPGYELRGQHRLGRLRPDHVIFKENRPQLVIETKVRVRRQPAFQWIDSPDFRQAAGYARRLGTRAALIDAGSIYLLSRDLTGVDRIIDRPNLNEEHIALIREFVGTPHECGRLADRTA